MPTFEAIQIFIFLIPGFISSRVFDSLVIRKQDQKELANIIEALILSMVIYTIYSFTGLPSPITLDQKQTTFSYNYDTKSFLILIGLSMVLPVLLAVITNNDWHMKLARLINLTKKTSRLSIWHDIFYGYDKQPMVVIDFVDGRRLFGLVDHFSDDPDNPYLYLTYPQWIHEQKYIQTGLEGILITPEQKIGFIEFLKEKAEQETSSDKKPLEKKGTKDERKRKQGKIRK